MSNSVTCILTLDEAPLDTNMVIEESNKIAVKDRIRAAITPKKKEPKTTKVVEPESEGQPEDDNKDIEDPNDRSERGHWKHPLDFLFSCISVSVGLGSK